MKREEYNEYRYIRSMLRQMPPSYGTSCTIRTDASEDYKRKLDNLYAEYGMHPGGIRIDPTMYDDKERIIYIYGRNDRHTDYYGREYGWSDLYTTEEKERFALALTDNWHN